MVMSSTNTVRRFLFLQEHQQGVKLQEQARGPSRRPPTRVKKKKTYDARIDLVLDEVLLVGKLANIAAAFVHKTLAELVLHEHVRGAAIKTCVQLHYGELHGGHQLRQLQLKTFLRFKVTLNGGV